MAATDTTRRILFISYWFPPAIGAAAERIGAFAGYLPEHGWEVHVLTPTHAGETPHTLDKLIIHTIEDPLAGRALLVADYDPNHRTPWLKSLARKLIFPDRFVRWQKAALRYATQLCTTQDFSLIFASFPPASVAQLGLRLHQKTRIPFVLDFRDRWIGPGGYAPLSSWTLSRHRTLEQDSIRSAAGIVTISDAMADAIAREHAIDRGRIAVIPNGYEPVTLAFPQMEVSEIDRASESTPRPITLAHVGSVVPRSHPDIFLQSVASLQKDTLSGITIKFVGNMSQAYLNELRLTEVVKTTGMLSRDAAREEMQHADVLLLLTGAYVGEWGISAKLFEYIQTGRPILCVEETPGSNDRRLLEKFVPDRAFFACLGDPQSLSGALEEVRAYLSQRQHPAIELDNAFREYSRPNLTAKLSEYLEAVLARFR